MEIQNPCSHAEYRPLLWRSKTKSISVKSMGDHFRPPTAASDPERILTINISGKCFETMTGTLERFPETLLGDPEKRKSYFNADKEEFLFLRHRGSFDSILYFYQTHGKVLLRPLDVPLNIFLEELQFFQIGQNDIDRFLASEGFKKVSLMMGRTCFYVG